MKRNDLLLRLICILCVTVMVCGLFSGCMLPEKDPQATEDPSDDPTETPTGDSSDKPTGGPSDEPGGDSTDTPSGGDSSIFDGENNPTIPFD